MTNELAEEPDTAPSGKAVRAVRTALLVHGPQSRAELQKRTGLARSTVARVAQTLVDQGVVREVTAPHRSARGRRPVLLALNSSDDLVGCLVLSHRELRASVLTLDGKTVADVRAPTDPLSADFDLVGCSESLLQSAMTSIDAASSRLIGVALAVPGPYQPGVGLVGVQELADQVHHIRGGQRLPTWMTRDPEVELADRLRVPVVVENDANLASVGEHGWGAAREARIAVVVTLYDGFVGAGLVLNGELCRGAAGMAGEIAHVSVVEDGPRCMCGRTGCLAAVFATTELRAPVQEGSGPLQLVDVFTRAAFGGSAVLPALLDATRHVGKVLADLSIWLNPDVIVIEGLDPRVAERVIAILEAEIDARAGHAVARSTRVLAGTLGEDATVLGGLASVRQRLAMSTNHG
ncbi:ROK family transcriptional regulator [Nocardioides sp. Iso805N]|uniref:ROK family transcriptional regulator n=1 Tax=Nocardioides sp. Iso805N TaxID=1283287 RepID=UPI00035C7E6C|nr:ROK family transcriptional regulator [Nocardioides sp. Iso805N]